MEVIRRIEKLVGHKVVLELPESFENQRVEVIVLTLDHDVDMPRKRRPHSSLAGKMTYDDNLFDSIPLADWGLDP